MRQFFIGILLALLLCASTLRAAETLSSTATTPAEAELGRQTAEQIEKDYKLVKDEAAISRLSAIATEIVPFTQRPDVAYTFKILDDNSVNAMAIPGGTIYVTKGLLSAVESDHELAGVIAHEMAHNSLYHSKKMIEREKTGSIAQILMVIASIYVGDQSTNNTNDTSVSPMQMLTLSEIVKQAIMNGYSIDLEAEADKNAVDYLYETKHFDPVGLYSVLVGFRQMEKREGKANLGYFKNHPDPQERMHLLQKEFARLQVPINLWNVINFRATVLSPEKDKTGYIVHLGSVDLVTFTTADAKERATAAADAINLRLTKRDTEIQRYDVRSYLDEAANIAYLKLRNSTIFTLTADDLAANNATTVDGLATSIKQNIQTALFNERLKRGM